MASASKRLPSNVAGEFFVDSTCIDCGTCREVAPETFAEGSDASYVHRQPAVEAQRHRARMALVACPVAAIGAESKQPMAAARAAFPELIEAGVYYCGFASESSYGARSYLVVRPEGNLLIDSPRFAQSLVQRIAALGGVRWMFLTHRDDVADHHRFRQRFGCERILHERDVTADTRDVEIRLRGEDGFAFQPDLTFLPMPGHTAGSTCLLFRGRFLFSGDHLWWDADGKRLHASRRVCWFDWREQRTSMARLSGHRFEWLLPGHGARVHLSEKEMAGQLAALTQRMGQG